MLVSLFSSIFLSVDKTDNRYTSYKYLLNIIRSLFWRTNVNMVWRQRTYVKNYVDQQTLKPDDDYVLPHRLCTFDVLVCPLSTVGYRAFPVTAARLWNNLSSHVFAALLSPSSAVVLNHIFSHVLIAVNRHWMCIQS